MWSRQPRGRWRGDSSSFILVRRHRLVLCHALEPSPLASARTEHVRAAFRLQCLRVMAVPCACSQRVHVPRLVVLTGGPGAGKTAVLEVVRRHFCEHVAVLPETASILFGGGFPRRAEAFARRAAQRAIYRVQVELERMVVEEQSAAVALCDRGTVDGLAYWGGSPESFWSEVGTSLDAELARYAAVIHLRSPSSIQGYNLANPVRTESAAEAAAIDGRILTAWERHPRRTVVASADDFMYKLAAAIEAIRAEVPHCCRAHRIDSGGTP